MSPVDERYLVGPMRGMWTQQAHYSRLKEAMAVIASKSDDDLAHEIRRVPVPANYQVADLELEYGHDIAAFVECIRRQLPREYAQKLHRGSTSSDLVDTAQGIALLESSEILNRQLVATVGKVADYARTWKSLRMLGRTHGQLAERTSLGRRWAVLACELSDATLEPYRFGHASGPVGVDTQAEDSALSRLGLVGTPSGQCVPRIRVYRWASQLALLVTAAEAVALEIRLGCQEGVNLYAEGRSSGYRGSSSMPIKRNPTRSERVCGLARVVRAYVSAIGESCALWNERDISHSSVERTALVPAVALAHYILSEVESVVTSLVTYDYNVVLGTERTTSAEALTALLEAGVVHTTAYRQIQEHGPEAACAWMGVSAEARFYDPATEPGLWDRIDALAVAEAEGLDKETRPVV